MSNLSTLVRRAGRASPPDRGLKAIGQLREELETLERHHVAEACSEGWSWSKIAVALGVTKQAAHKKHAEAVRALQDQRDLESVPTDARVVVTAEARDAVRFAREEARTVGSRLVGTEHLLLGVLHAEGSRGVGVLAKLGVDLAAARGCLQPTMAEEDRAIAVTATETAAAAAATGVSPLARACLEQSLRETIRRGDGHLGVEHLLLALVSRTDGGAARTLEQCGTSAETVRRLLEPRRGGRGGRRRATGAQAARAAD
jgi:Clp amino terminal domain, pathogenicity island component